MKWTQIYQDGESTCTDGYYNGKRIATVKVDNAIMKTTPSYMSKGQKEATAEAIKAGYIPSPIN